MKPGALRSLAARGPALLAILAVAIIAGGAELSKAAETPHWSGMLLRRALDELRSMGLDIIYSSDLVRPSMWVTTEPRATDPKKLLDEMLAPHGLASLPGPGGHILIVRAPEKDDHRAMEPDAREPEPSDSVVLDVVESVVVFADEGLPRGEGPAHRESLLGREISSVPSIASDPLLSFGSMPGIHRDDASAGLHVRGGAANESLILLDGLEIYEPFHLKEPQGLFSIVDGESVERLTVLGVGFPAEYGGRMSGVIDLVSADPSGNPETALSLGSEGARAAASGPLPLEGGRWLLSAREGFPDESLEATGAGGGQHHSFYDLFGKAAFDVGARSNLTFTFLGAVDDPAGATGASIPDDDDGVARPLRTSSAYAWVTLGTAWSSRLHSRTILSGAALSDQRVISGTEESRLEEARSTNLLGIKQDWARDGDRHLFKWGADLKFLQGDYGYRTAGEDPEVEAENEAELESATASSVVLANLHGGASTPLSGSDLALYATDVIRLTARFEVEAGLRWSQVSWVGSAGSMLDPRIGLAWKVGSASTIRTGWGIYHQPQRIDEVDLQGGIGGFHPSQRAEHRFISFDHDTARGLHLGAVLYDKKISALAPRYEILHDPHGLFAGAGDDLVLIEPEAARARGLEVTLRGIAREKLGWWAAAGAASTEESLGGAWAPRSWDQVYTLGWGVNLSPYPQWEIALSGSHHSGHPSAPLEVEIVTGSGGQEEIVASPSGSSASNFPAYHRLDLRISRSFTAGASEVEVFAGAANLLDRDNVCCAASSGFELLENGSVVADSDERAGLARLFFYGIRWRR